MALTIKEQQERAAKAYKEYFGKYDRLIQWRKAHGMREIDHMSELPEQGVRDIGLPNAKGFHKVSADAFADALAGALPQIAP